MMRIERSTRALLRTWGVSLAAAPLAQVAVELARRLDGEPGDRSVVMLSRELRLVLADLRAQVGGGEASDVEEYLRRVSTAAYDAGH